MSKFFKQYAMDSARVMTGHVDDAQSIWARNLVTSTLQQLYMWEYRQTPWASGELIDINSGGVDEGAESVAWLEAGNVGAAGIVATNATNIPYADVQGQLNLGKAHTIATAIQYTTQDLRAARLQGMFDIATLKAASAREAYDRQLDELIRLGSVPSSITGIVNAPGSWDVTATTGTWTTVATPSQMLADFYLAYNAIRTGTNGVENPNTAVFAQPLWNRISTTQNSIASDVTVLEFLKRAYPNISLWKEDSGLDAAGATGGYCVMLYDRSQTRVEALLPMVLKPLPMERKGLVFEMAFEARYAGLATHRPKSIARLSGLT
jgi:hypothetical protein